MMMNARPVKQKQTIRRRYCQRGARSPGPALSVSPAPSISGPGARFNERTRHVKWNAPFRVVASRFSSRPSLAVSFAYPTCVRARPITSSSPLFLGTLSLSVFFISFASSPARRLFSRALFKDGWVSRLLQRRIDGARARPERPNKTTIPRLNKRAPRCAPLYCPRSGFISARPAECPGQWRRRVARTAGA